MAIKHRIAFAMRIFSYSRYAAQASVLFLLAPRSLTSLRFFSRNVRDSVLFLLAQEKLPKEVRRSKAAGLAQCR